MKLKSVLTKSLAGFSLLLTCMSVHAEKVLVSSTDFSVPSKESHEFSSLGDLFVANSFGGLCIPSIKVGEGYTMPDPSIYSDKTSSYFLQGKHYSLVNNPIVLDSLRFFDNEEGFSGVVFSLGEKAFTGNPGQELMSYDISGLKSNGLYSIEIEYFNPLSQDYLNTMSDLNKDSRENGEPYLTSGYNATLKVGVNSKDGIFIGSPGLKSGSIKSSTISFTSQNTDLGAIVDGKLSIHIYANQYSGYESIGIKSIKVYAEVDPKIFSYSENTLNVGGETIKLELNSELSNCKIQWYKDGLPIAGANGTSYIHTSGKKEAKSTYHVVYTTSSGDKIKTPSFVVEDVAFCLDETGNPMSRKLVWQDDFGTFTEAGKYWIWDYSDLSNPKKVEKTTNGWQYALDFDIPGAKFVDVRAGEGLYDGGYTVAGNVTCAWDDLSGGDGTQWGWLASCFNGERPSKNGWKFVPDHTYNGSAWGGMLFLDCGNKPGESIYTREILGLDSKQVFAKCYINNYSEGEDPVSIKIRLTDLNSGEIVESNIVERYARYDGVAWKEVSASIPLTGANPTLKLEIIDVMGDSKEGNDLILDDIQLWTCIPMEEDAPIAFTPVIKGSHNICVGGESTKLSVDLSGFKDYSVQWYVNGTPIKGATNNAYLHTSGLTESSYSYQVKVTTSDGNTVSSKDFVVNDIACAIDDAGIPVSRKLIWQDDFGTFTSKGTYWVWDYSDISNPKKIHKTTTAANGWGYELDYIVPGAEFNDKDNDFVEGSYIVAGNVTCAWDDLSGGDGTQWGWLASCFNGERPSKNGWKFVPDHTYNGDAWGGMLFLNCGTEAGEPIYSRVVEGLCDSNVTLKCYINTFSNGEIPVEVKLRLTDLASGNVVESVSVENYSMEKGVGWGVLSCSINLTGGSLKFDIIDVDGKSNHGNDLILDDVQLWTAALPNVQLYFNPTTLAEDTTITGSDVTLYVNETLMSDVFFNGEQHYLYQWNKGPVQDNSKWNQSWKNIGTETQNVEYKVDLSELMGDESLKDGDEILFRVILADYRVLRTVMYFNPNEPCGAYSVSNVISMKVSRPTGIDNAEASDVRVVTLDNSTVQVQNAEPNAKVDLCNVCGMHLTSVMADEDGKATVTLPNVSGVYVVSVGENSFKVVR
ncbi:MAG: hypothetical protein MJZ19_11340 [Paludibacteraceae bacterium]|nr:hypothetical protein [Paludibacteraceae bacterium]